MSDITLSEICKQYNGGQISFTTCAQDLIVLCKKLEDEIAEWKLKYLAVCEKKDEFQVELQNANSVIEEEVKHSIKLEERNSEQYSENWRRYECEKDLQVRIKQLEAKNNQLKIEKGNLQSSLRTLISEDIFIERTLKLEANRKEVFDLAHTIALANIDDRLVDPINKIAELSKAEEGKDD